MRAGSAEGHTKLTAFDNALLKAKIGNVNLVRISSILPPGCVYSPDLIIPPGALTPTAYGALVSDTPGELLAAAVGVGISADSFGVIMEFSGRCGKREAEAAITQMVDEAFATRGMPLQEIKVLSTEHRVEKVGCAFAGVSLWY
jgi:arginine decarboxylase